MFMFVHMGGEGGICKSSRSFFRLGGEVLFIVERFHFTFIKSYSRYCFFKKRLENIKANYITTFRKKGQKNIKTVWVGRGDLGCSRSFERGYSKCSCPVHKGEGGVKNSKIAFT